MLPPPMSHIFFWAIFKNGYVAATIRYIEMLEIASIFYYGLLNLLLLSIYQVYGSIFNGLSKVE